MEGESVQADEKPRRVQVQVTVHIPGLLELIAALRPRRQPTPRGADGRFMAAPSTPIRCDCNPKR